METRVESSFLLVSLSKKLNDSQQLTSDLSERKKKQKKDNRSQRT